MVVLALPTESTLNSIILAISSTLIGTTDNRHTLYSVSFNSGNVFLIKVYTCFMTPNLSIRHWTNISAPPTFFLIIEVAIPDIINIMRINTICCCILIMYPTGRCGSP